MTQLTYQATSLRSLVKLMLPSAESKNFSESQMMYFGIREQNVKSSDGSTMHQHVLYAESTHPTFLLKVEDILNTDEVETDGRTLRVNSRDLDSALASFGQQQVTLRYDDQGQLTLSTPIREGEDAQTPVKTLFVGAEIDALYELPEHNDSLCVLQDYRPLLDGLKSVVNIASIRGNRLNMQGIRMAITPTQLRIEGDNPCVSARTQYDNPWLKAPGHSHEKTISSDAARHLIASLATLGTDASVHLNLEDDILCVHTEGVHFEGN